MLRQKSKTQHQIPVISNLPSTYFHLYTHGLTYMNPHSDTLLLTQGILKDSVRQGTCDSRKYGSVLDPPIDLPPSPSPVISFGFVL